MRMQRQERRGDAVAAQQGRRHARVFGGDDTRGAQDVERAAASVWRGLIASGWQTCGIAMRMVVSRILVDSESYGSPGLAYLKWENPVRPGDTLYLTLDVLERRVATSKPTLGIVRWRWRMRNQVAAVVLDLEATSLFDLANKKFTAVTGSAPA